MRRLYALALVGWLLGSGAAAADVSVTQLKVTTAANAFETDGVEALTFDVQVATGSYIVVGISLTATNRTISSVVDDGSNTYALLAQGGTDATQEFSGTSEIWLYGAPVTTAATVVTVTISSALGTPGRLFVLELDGQHGTTPIEDVVIATNNSVASHPVGPVTTAAAGNVLVGLAYGTSGTYTNEAGWTQVDNTGFGIAAYDTVGAASTSWTPTSAGNEQTALVLIAVQPAAAVGGGNQGLLLGLPGQP